MFNDREYNNKSTSTTYKEYDANDRDRIRDYTDNDFYQNERNTASNARSSAYNQEEPYDTMNAGMYEDPDLVPTKTTMNSVSNENYNKNDTIFNVNVKDDEEESARFKLTTRGKTLIAVYAIAVAVLFAVIVLNTTVLRTMNSRVESLQDEIEIMQDENQALTEELNFVQSEEEITRKAEAMGMIR